MGKQSSSATSLTTSANSLLKYKGIYYFKLNPEYFLHRAPGEDEQKSCGLLGGEIDSNFHFLSGYDIKDVEVENGILKIYRVNDEYNETDPLEVDLTGQMGNPTFNFNRDKGELEVFFADGTSAVTGGFFDGDFKVSSNGTLVGTGSRKSVLGLSPVEKTGEYAPVLRIVDRRSESGNTEFSGACGDRILTIETINRYGLLYPYSSVEKIQERLDDEMSVWRVPTREDWDELLNAMEESDEYKDHNVDDAVPFKGEVAGKVLKSSEMWEEYPDAEGLNHDKFNVLPVGIMNGVGALNGVNQQSYLWAYGLKDGGDVDIKKFYYKENRVGNGDERARSSAKYSVRLVRDYVPGCANEYEDILGVSLPTGVVSNGCDYTKVWTLANFYDWNDAELDGTIPDIADYEGEDAFFINEFNAEGRPVRKRMTEGDTVVVLEEGGYNEYMLSGGTLVNTFDKVSELVEDVATEASESLANLSAATAQIAEELGEAIGELSGKTEDAIANLSGETENAISALSGETENAINELSGNVETAIESLSGDVETAIEDAISELSGSVESAILEEEARAAAAEAEISGAVATIADEAESAITIANEISGTVEGILESVENLEGNDINKESEYEFTQDGTSLETNAGDNININLSEDFFNFGLIFDE